MCAKVLGGRRTSSHWPLLVQMMSSVCLVRYYIHPLLPSKSCSFLTCPSLCRPDGSVLWVSHNVVVVFCHIACVSLASFFTVFRVAVVPTWFAMFRIVLLPVLASCPDGPFYKQARCLSFPSQLLLRHLHRLASFHVPGMHCG